MHLVILEKCNEIVECVLNLKSASLFLPTKFLNAHSLYCSKGIKYIFKGNFILEKYSLFIVI